MFSQHRRGPIWRGLTFANSEGSQSGGVSILPIRRVLFLPIRRGTVFVNTEGYYILLKDLGKQKKR